MFASFNKLFSFGFTQLVSLGKRRQVAENNEGQHQPSRKKRKRISHDDKPSTCTSKREESAPLQVNNNNSPRLDECLAKRPSLKGVSIIFRCGNPSDEPCSRHEWKTFEAALEREDLKSKITGDAAKAFFENTGVSVVENVCPPELEERILLRIDEMLQIREEQGKMLRRRREQQFQTPNCCANREIYLVTESAHKRMRQQQGAPFSAIGARSRAAWVMEGQSIIPPGANLGFDASSHVVASNGTLMPDILASPNHSQNLDNPANKVFLDLWEILQNTFVLHLFNENENDSQGFGYDDKLHHLMAVQIILAEKGNGAAGGKRTLHQDGWASTGAAFLGVTLLNSRAITIRQGGTPKVEAKFALPRRSGYVCSGAARYGTLWKDLNLKFDHSVDAFDG